MNPTANHVPLLPPAAMLMLGIVAARWVEWPQQTWLIALSATVVAVFLSYRKRTVCSLFILGAMFLLGAFLSQRAEDGLKVDLPQEKVAYEAVLMSEPVRKGKVIRFDLAVLTPQGKPLLTKASLLCDTTTGRYRRLHVGDGIRAESYLEEPMNFYASDFDYARWLRLHGFKAETFVLPSDWQKARVGLKPLGWWNRVVIHAQRLRQRLAVRYYRQLGMDTGEAAVVAAMTLGDRSLLPKTIKEDYNRSGAAHVLALSGLHLGILCSVFSLFGRRNRRRKWLPTLLGVSAAWSFAVLTGLSPSVVRAALMLSVYGLIGMLGRDRQTVNALMATIIIMLLARSLSLYDMAFQLSVLAVLSIQLFLPLWMSLIPQREWGQRGYILRGLWGFLGVTVAAQVGTAPLVAYGFGRFSACFLLTNLIAVPCATAILYLALALFALTPLPWAQVLVGQMLAWVAQTMNQTLHWVANLPGATVENLHPTAVQTFLFYVLVLILWLFFKRILFIIKRTQDSKSHSNKH